MGKDSQSLCQLCLFLISYIQKIKSYQQGPAIQVITENLNNHRMCERISRQREDIARHKIDEKTIIVRVILWTSIGKVSQRVELLCCPLKR